MLFVSGPDPEQQLFGYTTVGYQTIVEGSISPEEIDPNSPFTMYSLGNIPPDSHITMQYNMGLGKFGEDLYFGIAGTYGIYLGKASEKNEKYEWHFDLFAFDFEQVVGKTIPIWLATTPPHGFSSVN